MTQEMAQRLLSFGVSTISDALDSLDIEGQAIGILPFAHNLSFAGIAFTVRMAPVGLTGGSVGDYIDDVPPGHVVVIDNDGRMDATVWGDILTSIAHQNKVAATVIDGVARDITESLELSYPIFARGHTMRTGKDRVTAQGYNEPVQIAGIRVEAGDWIVGDADGVVVLPKERLTEICNSSAAIKSAEDNIRNAVGNGTRLDEARKIAKYHSLQSKSTK